jgi:murein DD-endopeptidase MepM/ murein hydrolase activator NlpD
LILGVVFSWFFLNNYNQKSINPNSPKLKDLAKQYALLERSYDELNEQLTLIEQRDNQVYRSFFGLDTLNRDVSPSKQKRALYRDLSRLPYGKLVSRLTEKSDALLKRAKIQEVSLNQLVRVSQNMENFLTHVPAILPVEDKGLKTIASGFGFCLYPILRIHKMHSGIDFSVNTGTRVYATADGIVEQAGVMSGFGNVLIINHQNGYKTYYGHLSGFKTYKGRPVKRGQWIGLSGNTGLSSGPHLHYEVQKGKEKLNPIGYFYGNLTPSELKKMQDASEKFDISLD